MPRDAVSRTAYVERNGGQKWVNVSVDKRIHLFFAGAAIIALDSLLKIHFWLERTSKNEKNNVLHFYI